MSDGFSGEVSGDWRLLAIVPAVGRCRGLPGKLLRKLLGRPLLEYALETAKRCRGVQRVVVLTDDDEIAMFAQRHGAETFVTSLIGLDGSAADGEIALYRAVLAREEEAAGQFYEAFLILNPAVPLMQTEDLEAGLALLRKTGAASVVSACLPRQRWDFHGGVFLRDFAAARPIEQSAWQKTDAFVIGRGNLRQQNCLVREPIAMVPLPQERTIHIESQQEWWICEGLLQRKRILFVVAGNQQIGMGHVYRTLGLAQELVDHDVSFLCTAESDLAVRHITEHYHRSATQQTGDLAQEVMAAGPDLVINDFLDTSAEYVRALKEAGIRVIDFEDNGPGAGLADLVINALFEDPLGHPHFRTGPDYFCLRDEFLHVSPKAFQPKVEQVLITFGGTDEANLTGRVLGVIAPFCLLKGCRLAVVTGPGFSHGEALQKQVAALASDAIELARATRRMSEYMAQADLAISSAGRTLYELAHMRVPTMVIAANQREETHPFARPQNGFLYLGHWRTLTDEALATAFGPLLDSPGTRASMRACMEQRDFRGGKERVLREIQAVLAGPSP